MNGKTKACLAISFVNILWGLSFIASKSALSNGFQPFSLAFVRFFAASALLLPILKKRQGSLRPPRGALPMLLLSALLGMTLYFLFEYGGLQRTSASTASLIIAAVPAFTLIYGLLFRRQRYRAVCYLGVAFSLLGVFLIVHFGADGGGDTLLGNFMILGACLCWVGYIQVTDVLMRKCTSLEVTAWQSLLGALTLLPCALTEGLDWPAVTPVAWLMALYLAVLCSVVAYLLYVGAVRELEPLRAALFINLNPLAAVLGGVMLLGETLSPMQLVGGAIVLASIFLVNRGSAGETKRG